MNDHYETGCIIFFPEFYILAFYISELISKNSAIVRLCVLQVSLATDLQSLSNELRKKQSNYLKRLKQQKEVRKEI